MAEVTGLRNSALPYPVYGVPYGLVFPILDADGDLVTGAASLDSEVSLNGDTFADATNEATEIATSSGMYYLLLTAANLTCDVLGVIVKTATAGAKTTPMVLYPRKLVSLRSGTVAANAADGTTLQLDSGASGLDHYYEGCLLVGTIDSVVEDRIITGYVGSTKVCTVTPAFNTAPDNNDTFVVYLPEGKVLIDGNTLAWNGTVVATPATAGIPDVNVKNIDNDAASASGTVTFPNATLASTTNITAGTVTTATNVTTVNGLAAGVITATSIAADAITAAKVADGTIDAATFAAGAINAAAIAADAITAAKIADGAIDASTFAAGAINAAAIASDAITDAKVASDVTIASVTGSVGSVTGAVGSVTGAVGSVTGNVGGNVTGSVGSVASGGITAASIATNAIDADALAADAVTEIQSGLATAAALATVQADTDDIQTRLPAALVSGRIDASVGAMAADVITATAIAADAITDAKVASDVTIASVTGSVGSVTGAVGSVTGNLGGNVTGTIGGLTAAALKDLFDTDSTTTYASAVAGSVVKEIADNAGGASLTVQAIVDGVWDETIADHLDAGSTGAALNTAGSGSDPAAIADAVWDEDATGHQTQGTFGQVVGDSGATATSVWGLANTNLNATVGSRATQTSVDDLPTNAELATALAAADDAVLAAIAALNNLSQANVRSAVGLASANLDTQLDALPTNAELATALGTADDAVLAAIAALNNLSQANIRTAVGLGSANLDTQLGDLPTNAELATALGTADDAVLAAIAALNNLSAAGVRSAVGLASANLDTQLDALPTNSELATALAAADDAVLSALAALNNLSAAQVLTQVQTALTDTVADSIPADGTRPSIAQGIYLLTQFMLERSVAGTTMTVKKPDGSTTLITITLDDATTPTSLTRAS